MVGGLTVFGMKSRSYADALKEKPHKPIHFLKA